MINTYSLADHQLVIGMSTETAQRLNLKDANGNLLKSYTIGGPGENGEGSFVGQILVSLNDNLYETEGDATGSWVHNKNLNRTGLITLEINQISDDAITLIQLTQILESVQSAGPGLELTINSVAETPSTTMVTGRDSMIQKLPDLTLAEKAGMLSWVFTCGQVIYEHSR